MNKKIVVTGANGQVGKALLANRDAFPIEIIGFTRDEFDITSDLDIDKHINQDTAIVINAAAYTKVDQAEDDSELCFTVNHFAVEKIAKKTAELDIPFIHISSDYVYSPDHEESIDERHITKPKSIYAESKLAGDEAALKIHQKSIILRTSWVYDATGHNFVNTITRLGKSRDELNIVNDQIGSPTFAKNIADAISTISKQILTESDFSQYGIYHFSDEGYISWYEFAKAILELQNIDCHLFPIPSSEYPTKAHRPLNSRLDKTKIKETFDVKIKHWKESLQECLLEKETLEKT